MTIDDFSSYLLYELNRAPLTVEAYRRDLNQFADFIGHPQDDIDPLKIKVADIRSWIASLAKSGQSPRTLRRKLQSLRAFFRFMRKRAVTISNPARDISLPKLPKPLPDHIRMEEIEKILAQEEARIAITPPEESETELRTHLIMEMLYSLGIRRAELIAIDDTDIDHTGAELKVKGKRSKQRIVPLPQRLLRDIERWQKLRDSIWADIPLPAPLFIVKGKRISPSQVYQTVNKELAGATSARKKSPHALRHTFATTMLNEGADLNSVKEFLGHASLSTTQIYTHISFAEMKKAYSTAHPRAKENEEEK